MRELSFKGYLSRQLKELSGCNSVSLYKFSRLAKTNARLKDALTLYITLFTSEKLKNQLCKKYPYLDSACKKINGSTPDRFDDSLSGYKTIYENYLNQKNKKANEGMIKALMQKQIVERQAEKGITNYRIYKNLNLNPGNVNAFLRNGDVSKVGLDTARNILSFVNQY